jgi:hypothetical protein
MWWAEIRRHVPDESALAVGSIAAAHLPKGLTRAALKLAPGEPGGLAPCSSVAFLPAGTGSPGSDASKLSVAPPDAEGMASYVAWSSTSMRTHCQVSAT